MDRKTTIKILREITRILKDDALFSNNDFVDKITFDLSKSSCTRVQHYIIKKLEL